MNPIRFIRWPPLARRVVAARMWGREELNFLGVECIPPSSPFEAGSLPLSPAVNFSEGGIDIIDAGGLKGTLSTVYRSCIDFLAFHSRFMPLLATRLARNAC